MVEELRIAYLADCVDVLPQLEEWFVREWEPYYGPDGPGHAADDLRSSCNRSTLPITLVAFWSDELCGTGALKAESVTTHRHLGPWVAALLVASKYRRQGIRGRLVKALEEMARSLGFEQLYYGASVTDRYLESYGWEWIERVDYLTGEGSIYRKTL